MKRVLPLCTILLILISCLKETFIKNESQLSTNTAYSINSINKLNLDSISRMNAGEFRKSELTLQELDSIKKLKSNAIHKSTLVSLMESGEYTDASGFIHLKIFYQQSTTPLLISHAEALIDDSYVLVGGGGYSTWNWFGAFLYESRPNDTHTGWMASSKAHFDKEYHQVIAYAIGMRIDGVTAEYLRSKVHYYSSTSTTPLNHPEWTVEIPSNELLIGGGALDHWEEDGGWGNMLTASYPVSSNTWRVMGKDHRRADPSVITAYAIGIDDISYPNVGYLQINMAWC